MSIDATPSLDKTAFQCPHCTAFAHQDWHTVYVKAFEKDYHPVLLTEERVEKVTASILEENRDPSSWIEYSRKVMSGMIAFSGDNSRYVRSVGNLVLSQCYSCNNVSVWVYGKIVFPVVESSIIPNPDLSDDIRRDFSEAASILDQSPRGAAALLRLAIQKLCRELGESGQNLSSDISALVKKGLDQRIAKSLDIIRVIGNNAVHPGQIDLRDDKKSALILFDLLNLIAEKTISEQKHIDQFITRLPASAQSQIARRDKH